jgi:hypothetical protein
MAECKQQMMKDCPMKEGGHCPMMGDMMDHEKHEHGKKKGAKHTD